MRLSVTLALLTASALVAEPNPFRWKGFIQSGRIVEIKGVNGDVFAEPSNGPEVEVVANVTARESNPEAVKVELVEHDGGVTVCAVYPSESPENPNRCLSGESGQQVSNNDVRVNFTVRVPKGVALVGRTVNGHVQAASLQSDVEAYTVNGKVNIITTGSAQARTVNGSIFASVGNPFWHSQRQFSTVNGTITVKLPPKFGADLKAHTVNGKISTEFPLSIRGQFSPRKLSGKIGAGGRMLTIETVNGSIELKKAS